VKTIRTLGGSVWGGKARLIEEASIGMMEGPDEYLFGRLVSICAAQGKIYAIDQQVPAVRTYDLAGQYLGNLGRKGGGPGEYERPTSITVDQTNGIIYVRDGIQGRMNLYSLEGESIKTWKMVSGISTTNQMVLTHDGDIYTMVLTNMEGEFRDWDWGMARMTPEGPVSDTLFAPKYDFTPGLIEHRTEEGRSISPVPFTAGIEWALTPSLRMLGGVSNQYRFEIHHPDGAVTVVEKEWDKVPVLAEEARWYRDRSTASFRREAPGWAWNGPPIPNYKPAFDRFIPDRNGRIWVRRPGPGIHLEGGDDHPEDSSAFYRNPAWKETFTMDVFDEEGRFLGELELPDGFQTSPQPFINGEIVIAVVEGDDDVPYIKRFRLELPASVPEQ